MTSFFTTIYCWFEKLFGLNVAEHLRGWSDATNDFSNPNLFPTIGCVSFGIALLICVLFYYVINHPSFNRWWSWLIMLLVQATINLFYGWWFLRDEMLSGKIADSLMYVRDADGEVIQTVIDNSSCWYFGFANCVVSIIAFFVFTLMLKWWSRNCKNCPF